MTNFSHINRFIVRTPYYSLGEYHQIPKDKAGLDAFTNKLFKDTFFKEAVFLASPELFYEWERSLNETVELAKKNKIQASILKYFMRASTRSTPFGLFSGYTELKEETFDENKKLERFSGIDLHFLYTIIKRFNADLKVRGYLKFSPNTTIYKVGGFYRYVEYIIKNKKREHSLIELEADEVLELIFNTTSSIPKSMDQIITILLDSVEGVTREEVIEYVKTLIDDQILISDLDIVINNESPLNQIILFFQKNIVSKTSDKHIIGYYNLLLSLQSKLLKLDANLKGNSTKSYEEIFKIAEAFKVPFNKKYLINTNLHKKVKYDAYKLETKEISEIKKAINILSLFSYKQGKTDLDDFKKAFYDRYEDREIPLCIALDNEIGIGYLQYNKSFNSFSSLIDDVRIKGSEEAITSISYHNKIHKFWAELLENKNKGVAKSGIDLKQENLSGFKSQLDKLSNSFYAMLHKVADKISVEVVGGSSALNLISRFGNSDTSISKVFEESVSKEKEEDENIIVAELLHVPDNRSGNILLRNVKRDFEVAFLSKGNKDVIQIKIDDLYISLRNDKIILRSKKLNKRVKIINTTAHNYQYNALPIYQFLGSLQLEDTLPALDLNIGVVNRKAFPILPRISYGDIILSPASWSYKIAQLTSFYDATKGKINEANLEVFIADNKIPRYINLREGQDNTMRIDLKNAMMYPFLEESIRKNNRLRIEEALHDESVKGTYMAEYIIPFFKKDKKAEYTLLTEGKDIKRSFMPGEEWLYYKIYTGHKTANKLLVDVIKPFADSLISQGLIKNWHFIRFNDPDFHIRLRFQFEKEHVPIDVITKNFNKMIESYVENHFVWKIELATYNRELERYGWNMIEHAESFFYRDSVMVVALLKALKDRNTIENEWLVLLKSIDGLYDVFDVSLEKRHHHMNGLYTSFLSEFNADRAVKKQIETKFRLHRDVIESVIDFDESSVFYQIIEERNRKIIEDVSQLKINSITQMRKFTTSFIHMYVNRMAISNPRMHELVVYGMLTKYYSSKIGKEKHIKSKIVAV